MAEHTPITKKVARAHGLRRRRSGFTFVEMMVVITIIVILITIAIPIYQKSIIRAKESVLKNNLFTLRTVIDNYTYDKEKAPQSLPDLVTDGYLKKMPLDPPEAVRANVPEALNLSSRVLTAIFSP